MSDSPATQPPTSSEPPAARIGRAYIDAVSDGLQNLFAMGIIAYFWNKGTIDGYVALGGLGVILGFVNAGQLLDRFTTGRAPRAPLSALLGLAMTGKGASAAMTAAEIARRTMLALPLLFVLQGCDFLRDAKPVARRVNDIAREFCEMTMGAEAQKQGITVKDLCMLPHIFAPFLEAPMAAARAAQSAP